MPYLKTIVKYINQTLLKTVLNDKRFQNSKVIEIAQALPRKNGKKLEYLPSYVDNDGEAKYVGAEDDFDLIIYHKINSIDVSKATVNKGFGDDTGYQGNVARMSMIIFGRRDKLKLTNDDLSLYLQSNIPEAVTKQLLVELQFKAANININSIVLNDLQVFQEEYPSFEFFLKPEQFLFKINYTIESAYLKRCFNNCK